MPVARRVLGDNHEMTLKMRWIYARVLYLDEGASLDDRREAVATLESVAHSWKRIFGPAHPETPKAQALKHARARPALVRPWRDYLPTSWAPLARHRRDYAATIFQWPQSVVSIAPSFRLELGGVLGLLRTVFISHLSHIRIGSIVSSSASVARVAQSGGTSWNVNDGAPFNALTILEDLLRRPLQLLPFVQVLHGHGRCEMQLEIGRIVLIIVVVRDIFPQRSVSKTTDVS